MGKSKLYLKRGAPLALTCTAAFGVIATAVTAVRATPKAVAIIEARSVERHGSPCEWTAAEAVRDAWKCYIPAALIGTATIVCLFGANALNARSQAALTSAYALLDRSYREYKEAVAKLYGADADERVHEELAKSGYGSIDILPEEGKELFYDAFSHRYFESTMTEVVLAEYELNRLFALRGAATVNDFYKYLDIPEIEAGNTLGWSLESGWSFYGYSWVDFEHKRAVMDDGLECWIVSLPFEPTPDEYDKF